MKRRTGKWVDFSENENQKFQLKFSDSPGALNALISSVSVTKSPKKLVEARNLSSVVPSTRGPTGDLNLELDGEAQEAMEPVEGDVGDVLDVGWPPDLHLAAMDGRDHVLASSLNPARGHGLPQRREQDLHRRQLAPLLLHLHAGRLGPLGASPFAAAPALRQHYCARHVSALLSTSPPVSDSVHLSAQQMAVIQRLLSGGVSERRRSWVRERNRG